MHYCFKHDVFKFIHNHEWVCGACEAAAGRGEIIVVNGRRRWKPSKAHIDRIIWSDDENLQIK